MRPPCRPATPVEQVGPETSLQYEGVGALSATGCFGTELAVFVNNDLRQHPEADADPAAGRGRARRSAARRSRRRTRTARCSSPPRPCRCSCAPTSTTRASGASSTAREARLGARRLAAHGLHLHPRARHGDRICRRTSRGARRRRTRGSRCAGRAAERPVVGRAVHARRLGADAPVVARPRRPPHRRRTHARSSIRAFFLNGARARGWISPGADGAFGTADDLLTATGETLAQIQDRVLGVGVNSSSLFPDDPRLHRRSACARGSAPGATSSRSTPRT